jgi:hypothetical protein
MLNGISSLSITQNMREALIKCFLGFSPKLNNKSRLRLLSMQNLKPLNLIAMTRRGNAGESPNMIEDLVCQDKRTTRLKSKSKKRKREKLSKRKSKSFWIKPEKPR